MWLLYEIITEYFRQAVPEPPDSGFSNAFSVFTPQQTCSPQLHSYCSSTDSTAQILTDGLQAQNFLQKMGLWSWRDHLLLHFRTSSLHTFS